MNVCFDKFKYTYRVLAYKPKLVVIILVLSGFAALMEGIGLSFVYPIFEVSQSDTSVINPDNQVIGFFSKVYDLMGIDLNLETLLLGISVATMLRYVSSFMVGWLKSLLSASYEAHLKRTIMSNVSMAEISLFDSYGYDSIVNHVTTETSYSAKCIVKAIELLENISLIAVYVAVMTYVAPFLTVYAFLFLGSILGFLRFVVEPAVGVGTRLADANKEIQEDVHAGLYGIRDIKLFNLNQKIFCRFKSSISKYRKAKIDLDKNNLAMKNFYRMTAAVGLFLLIYIGIKQVNLSLGDLGVFFLAMMRLAMALSTVNAKYYKLEGYLSHLERSQKFLETATGSKEDFGGESIEEIEEVQFEDVSFSYKDKQVIKHLSFNLKKGDTMALVGSSGVGKSTVAALMAQLYQPESGTISSSGKDISEFNLVHWRNRIAVVRQQAYIFNRSLKENVMIGKPGASEKELKEACKIAHVDEFVSELPNGYDSEIGEDGDRLSGGQKQRVSIARAVLKDADILILDEATSDLDSKLEGEVLNAIERSDKDYGLMIIAHRLAAIKDADTIKLLSNGQIVNEGAHKELIKHDERYKQLYEAQEEV